MISWASFAGGARSAIVEGDGGRRDPQGAGSGRVLDLGALVDPGKAVRLAVQ